MSSGSQNIIQRTSGKGRLNLQRKISNSVQENEQSERFEVEIDNHTNDLLHQASDKYLEDGHNYVDFKSPQFFHQLQREQQQNKQQKSQQNTLRVEEKPVDNEKNAKKSSHRTNKKKVSTVYGTDLSQCIRKNRKCQELDTNQILQLNQGQHFNIDQEQKQNQASEYYQQPYNRFFLRKKETDVDKRRNKSNSQSPWDCKFVKSTYNNSQHQQFVRELEDIIFTQVKTMQLKQLKGNFILEHVTDDLEIQTENYLDKIYNQRLSPEQLLKTRMHIQAISKLMVFVHGKSQFRLVTSHFYIGQAYRKNTCYEQAIDHFTIALKKNAKLTEVKQTKIYHSFILTSLSECYFQIQMYQDALEILLRAYQIQQCYVNSELRVNNIKTIRLISECYLKMKNYRHAIEYIQKISLIIEKIKGPNSIEYAEIKFEKAVIAGQQSNRLGAIEQIKAAIELVQANTIIDPFQKDLIVLQYSKKLADFLEIFGDSESQVKCLRKMLKIIDSLTFKDTAQKNFFTKQQIAIKKKIIVISVRQSDFPAAIKELQQVLQLEQQRYGSESVFFGKTLKMLGLVHLHLGNDRHAQEYFKRCYKLENQSKEMKGQMNDLYSIFRFFGYGNRSSFKKNTTKAREKKISVS